MEEIKVRVDQGERAIVTTLTKRMAEDLTDYLRELGIKVQYLHSEVDTLERVAILRDLRLGVFDVVVGINLLREGIDLPEVTLVAILDADKEGFLRSAWSLIQMSGRAARNIGGEVVMYADRVTDSMRAAIDETDRRRAIQEAYNLERGHRAGTIVKGIRDLNDQLRSRRRGHGHVHVRARGAGRAAARAGHEEGRAARRPDGGRDARRPRRSSSSSARPRSATRSSRSGSASSTRTSPRSSPAPRSSPRSERRRGRAGRRARSRQPVGAGVGWVRGRRPWTRATASDSDPDAPSSVFEVTEVTVLPAGVEPAERDGPAEGTAVGLAARHPRRARGRGRLAGPPARPPDLGPNRHPEHPPPPGHAPAAPPALTLPRSTSRDRRRCWVLTRARTVRAVRLGGQEVGLPGAAVKDDPEATRGTRPAVQQLKRRGW